MTVASVNVDNAVQAEKSKQADSRWLIWSNEHRAWWKAGHHGYTTSKLEAGKYTQQEAVNIVRQANFYLKDDDIPNEAMILAE